jgi:hypothetical protein
MENEGTKTNKIGSHVLMLLLLSISILPSCIGKVVESRIGSNPTDGITVYPPVLIIEEWINTTLVDKDGNMLADYRGDSGTKCFPVPFEKVVTRPDFEHPYRISYEHGFLERYEFAVSLEEGMLKSVNVKSETDRGETLKNLAGAAKDAASIASAAAPAASACTSGPKVIKFRRGPTT